VPEQPRPAPEPAPSLPVESVALARVAAVIEPPVIHPVPPPRHGMVAVAAIGVVSALAVILGFVRYNHSHKRPQPPPVASIYKVTFHSSPPGATIRVSGKTCGSSTCEVRLAPGSYEAQAELSGYQPLQAPFTVAAGQTAPDIELTLVPAPPILTLTTDLTEGTVALDGTPVSQIQSGELEIANIPPGKHTVSVQSATFKAALPMEMNSGAMPKLIGPMQTSNLKGFVVARSGNEALVYSSLKGATAIVDGKPAGVVSSTGLEVRGLSPGPHTIMLEGPGSQLQNIAFEAGPSSGIFASLITDRNQGVLRILADDGVDVYLNGQKYRKTTKNGRLLVYGAPKVYAVRVEKAGFVSPADQIVDLKKGEEIKLEFKLLPARASLNVHNAPQGTEVWLDGIHIGNVRPDGSLAASDIEPGKHVVSLKHERTKPIQTELAFLSGKTVDLEGKLEAALGVLKIEVSPPGVNARLRLRREGETVDREITETTLNLQEGAYIIFGSAARHQDGSTTVYVTPNRTSSATLTLKRVEGKQPAAAEKAGSFGLQDWEKVNGWTREGGQLIHRGGEFVLAPVKFGPGVVAFSAILVKGKRIEWVLDFHDAKNYALFQIDDKNFNRMDVLGGKKSDPAKIPHGIDRKGYVTINIVFNSNSVSHSILRDQRWQLLDKWQRPGLTRPGSFGFHIPGKDELAISKFHFTPD
jgi:hypothetical protein